MKIYFVIIYILSWFLNAVKVQRSCSTRRFKSKNIEMIDLVMKKHRKNQKSNKSKQKENVLFKRILESMKKKCIVIPLLKIDSSYNANILSLEEIRLNSHNSINKDENMFENRFNSTKKNEIIITDDDKSLKTVIFREKNLPHNCSSRSKLTDYERKIFLSNLKHYLTSKHNKNNTTIEEKKKKTEMDFPKHPTNCSLKSDLTSNQHSSNSRIYDTISNKLQKCKKQLLNDNTNEDNFSEHYEHSADLEKIADSHSCELSIYNQDIRHFKKKWISRFNEKRMHSQEDQGIAYNTREHSHVDKFKKFRMHLQQNFHFETLQKNVSTYKIMELSKPDFSNRRAIQENFSLITYKKEQSIFNAKVLNQNPKMQLFKSICTKKKCSKNNFHNLNTKSGIVRDEFHVTRNKAYHRKLKISPSDSIKKISLGTNKLNYQFQSENRNIVGKNLKKVKSKFEYFGLECNNRNEIVNKNARNIHPKITKVINIFEKHRLLTSQEKKTLLESDLNNLLR